VTDGTEVIADTMYVSWLLLG